MRWLDRAAAAATLMLPALLLHARGPSDVAQSLVAALFLLRSALSGEWRWLRRPWVRIGLAWWLWLVLCSVLGGGVAEALAVVRFLLLAAALEFWLLRETWLRTWLIRLLQWSAFYVAAQCALQFATGRNLFGTPRGGDGELTGPYPKPRAGPVLSRLLFPALLPLASTPVRAMAWLLGGVVVMVLIGQRMPLLLTFLGLFTTALFLRRLRAAVLYTAVAAGLLLAALPSVSPQASHRIESEFTRQLANLPDSHYGQIAARSVAIIRAHPLLGAGFDGFRRLCDAPRYFQGWRGDAGGGAAICVQHPHSYYLQAMVEGGLPGLALFAALALAWLVAIGRGLFANPDRLRVGLFVAALIQLWPIASSTDWVAMPVSGRFFLQLGLALALAPPYIGEPRHTLEG